MNFPIQAQRLEAQRHRRTKICCRLRYGVVELARTPWKMIIPMLILVLFLFAWNNRAKVPLPSGNGAPLPVNIWLLVITLLTVILATFLFLAALILVGTPHRAREVEACLIHIALVDRYGFGPILVTSHRIPHTDITTMTFLSHGISMEAWEKKQSEIEDRLNVHFVECLKYGGKRETNRNYIVLTAAPGVGIRREVALYDDEL